MVRPRAGIGPGKVARLIGIFKALGLEREMLLATRPLLVAAVLLCAPLTMSCGRSGPPAEPTATPAPTPTPTPTATPTPTPVPFDAGRVVDRSGQIMQDLGSFHFRLHHEAGGTELMPQFVIDEAEGDVVSPDQISISFSGSFAARFAIEASLITLGAYSYMTNPLTGQWEAVATGVSPLGFFSPTRGIDAIMSQVEQLYLLENGGRQEMYRLGGTVAAEALASLLGPTLEGVDVRAELTIDADSLYLLQVRVLGRVIPSDAEDVVRVITLSAFDEPVSIEAPR